MSQCPSSVALADFVLPGCLLPLYPETWWCALKTITSLSQLPTLKTTGCTMQLVKKQPSDSGCAHWGSHCSATVSIQWLPLCVAPILYCSANVAPPVCATTVAGLLFHRIGEHSPICSFTESMYALKPMSLMTGRPVTAHSSSRCLCVQLALTFCAEHQRARTPCELVYR